MDSFVFLIKKYLRYFLMLALLAGGFFIVIRYYSFLFSKKIEGHVVDVQRVTQPSTIFSNGGQVPPDVMFSFAIAVRDDRSGQIYTASSEDRQWAVVQKGQCAQARLFPYAPWSLDKAGTYFGARLLKLYDCP